MKTSHVSSAVDAVVRSMLDKSEPEESGGSDLTIAAEDILAAIKAGDAQALGEALRAAVSLCDGDYEPEHQE
jgi:hypothetical protein